MCAPGGRLCRRSRTRRPREVRPGVPPPFEHSDTRRQREETAYSFLWQARSLWQGKYVECSLSLRSRACDLGDVSESAP